MNLILQYPSLSASPVRGWHCFEYSRVPLPASSDVSASAAPSSPRILCTGSGLPLSALSLKAAPSTKHRAPATVQAPLATTAGAAAVVGLVNSSATRARVTTDRDASSEYSVSLSDVRSALIRQEDSIIFSLIERAQFRLNDPAYRNDGAAGGIVVPGFCGSLFDYVLMETEILHGKVRRYTSPTERPFFPHAVPEIILPPIAYPKVLHQKAQRININSAIWDMYFGEILPAIAEPGDDGNYGSAVTSDVLCLQALSKRIHYGVFVAEAKFLQDSEACKPLILTQDADGLLSLLTKPDVEAAVLRRVEAKAAAFGQDIDTPAVGSSEDLLGQPARAAAEACSGNQDGALATGAGTVGPLGEGKANQELPGGLVHRAKRYKVEPQVVAQLYGRWIMPLTKQVQVEYLLQRLDPEEP